MEDREICQEMKTESSIIRNLNIRVLIWTTRESLRGKKLKTITHREKNLKEEQEKINFVLGVINYVNNVRGRQK